MVQMDFVAANHVRIVGLIDNLHHVVIFAIAQLSCCTWCRLSNDSIVGKAEWKSIFSSISHYLATVPSRSLISSDKLLPRSSCTDEEFLLALQKSGMTCLLTAMLQLV